MGINLDEATLASLIASQPENSNATSDRTQAELEVSQLCWRSEFAPDDIAKLAGAARRAGMTAGEVCGWCRQMAAYLSDLPLAARESELASNRTFASGMAAGVHLMRRHCPESPAVAEQHRDASEHLEHSMAVWSEAFSALRRCEKLREDHPDWFVGRPDLATELDQALDA